VGLGGGEEAGEIGDCVEGVLKVYTVQSCI
jgi:hypothetical protein